MGLTSLFFVVVSIFEDIFFLLEKDIFGDCGGVTKTHGVGFWLLSFSGNILVSKLVAGFWLGLALKTESFMMGTDCKFNSFD